MTRIENSLGTLHHLIIDMDGVLYRGDQAIPGMQSFLVFLRTHGIRFVLATNNSTRTPEQYVDRLDALGARISLDEILTSSQATAGYLKALAPPGTRLFVIGQDGLRTALRNAGFRLVEDSAEYVVVGLDVNVCFERLSRAARLVHAGAKFIGTNPDRTLPGEQGITPGAGALLSFLEAATGQAPTVIGKPGTAMLEQALIRMGADATTTAILGDRLETDILAGQRAGLRTLLVLSGVTDTELLKRSEIQPDLVFRDVGHLHATWQRIFDG
jgi:4-nitrophenyl phosphatase